MLSKLQEEKVWYAFYELKINNKKEECGTKLTRSAKN